MHRHLFRQDQLDIHYMDFDRDQNKLHNFFLNFVVDVDIRVQQHHKFELKNLLFVFD